MNAGFLGSDLGMYISHLLECARFGQSNMGKIHPLLLLGRALAGGGATGQEMVSTSKPQVRKEAGRIFLHARERWEAVMFLERGVLVISAMPNVITEMLLLRLDNWLFNTKVRATHHSDLLICYQVWDIYPLISSWYQVWYIYQNWRVTSQIKLHLYFNSTKSNSAIQPWGTTIEYRLCGHYKWWWTSLITDMKNCHGCLLSGQ